MIKQMYDSVVAFHTAFNVRTYDMLSFVPTDVLDLRAKLIIEEEKEYDDACIVKDKLAILDAICDLLYVNCGLAHITNLGVREAKAKNTVTVDEDITDAVTCIVDELYAPIPCNKTMPGYIDTLNDQLIKIALNWKFKLEPAFAEVHRANKTKLWTDDQRFGSMKNGHSAVQTRQTKLWIVKNSAGKVQKPPGWTAPNLAPYV